MIESLLWIYVVGVMFFSLCLASDIVKYIFQVKSIDGSEKLEKAMTIGILLIAILLWPITSTLLGVGLVYDRLRGEG